MENKITIKTVIDWITILIIFSFITAIANFIGYHSPIGESLIGMFILCAITLVGLLMEYLIPKDIPSIIYISIIGLIVALPISPISGPIIYYTAKINLVSITTILLAYAGIAMGNNLHEFKKVGVRGVIVTFLVITGSYVGAALVAEAMLILTGVI